MSRNKVTIMISHKYTFSILSLLSSIFLTIFFPLSVFPSTDTTNQFQATVIKIIDGDTIEVANTGVRKTIRLWGIDTPEWDQPYSKKAKRFLKKTILHSTISVQPLYYDKYGRLISILYKNDENINQLLIEKGLAWVHIFYCNKEICRYWKEIEKNARLERKGLWHQPNPTPPWQWKHYQAP